MHITMKYNITPRDTVHRKVKGIEFYTQGSDAMLDKQQADDIQIIQTNIFKWNWHLTKYDLYDWVITKNVVKMCAFTEYKQTGKKTENA